MDIKNLILIIIAVLNFFVGTVVILKNYRNKINLSFAFLLFSVVGWSIGLAMSRELVGTIEAVAWSKSAYYFAILIAYLFFYFTTVFPYQKYQLNFIQKFLLSLPLLVILTVLLKGDLLIIGLQERSWGYDIIFGTLWYLIYSLIFGFYMVWSYINLAGNLKKTSGYIKFQVSVVLFGFIISGIFGIVFDLILPYFGYWKLNWFGPYFSIILLFVIAYNIFYKSSKNI